MLVLERQGPPAASAPAAVAGGLAGSEPTELVFARYRLLPQTRQLLADGRCLELSGRAIDLLCALIGARGNVLSHAQLMRAAWPGQVVDETNLRVQICALRKALAGDRHLIRTVAGRGYQFGGQLQAGAAALPPGLPAHHLPAPSGALIGRAPHLREAAALLASHRLLSLVGVGGIGKTRLGLELVRRQQPVFGQAVRWVELGSLTCPGQFESAIGAAFGLDQHDALAQRLAEVIGPRPLLLVLDNCDPVIDAVAALAQTLLRACPGLRLLVTSRQPLLLQDEVVYRVPALALPAPDETRLGALLDASAVQLFFACVSAAGADGMPGASSVALAAAICRRLEGMPLAIELAAARAPTFGLAQLAADLDNLLEVLAGGRRGAPPRHRTLRAALEWSYVLLDERERAVLSLIALFPAPFCLAAASRLAGAGQYSAHQVADAVAGLVSKSMLSVELLAGATRYRLAETTRAYALDKLRERGEYDHFAQRLCDGHEQDGAALR